MRPLSRRDAVKLSLGTLAALGSTTALPIGAQDAATESDAKPAPKHPLITPATKFNDVSRGNPKPHSLQGEALVNAKLTEETWRLEVTADTTTSDAVKVPAQVQKQLTLAEGTALDFAALLELGKQHRVMFLKAMQCLNIPQPLGQGLWEGVPLRDVLKLCGKITNVRRVYYWGFHNDDPKQMFRSSLSYSQVMETPPGELPVFIAYKLNGEPLPLVRGGPVRMLVPWAHGFKSIKWLQRIVLTNDYRANDTYADANNDPESHLKTAAYLDEVAAKVQAGKPVHVGGLAICGWSGLERVECWVRPASAQGELAEDDPEWETAKWTTCELAEPPADWSDFLPVGAQAQQLLGFDRKTGKPLDWPLKYSMVTWSATLRDLAPGRYEVRARAVDRNGFAQPEPRSIQKTGRNGIQVRKFEVN